MHGRLNRWTALPRGVGVATTALAVVLAVFWLVVRFWLPGVIRTQAETALTEALHRPVTIGAIEIRPFALSLAVRDFAVAGGTRTAAASPPDLLSFAELYVDLSVASLWHRAPVVSELRLVDPAVHLVREADGRLSIADLAGRPGAPEDDRPAGTLPGFSLANVEIRGGRLVFEDRQKGSRQEISELALGIPFAGTIAQQRDDWVEPYFKARLNGAPVEAAGKVKPFADRREATLEVRLKDLDLTGFDEYAPLPAGLKILSARLDLDLDLVFVQAPGQPIGLKLRGGTVLRAVEVENVGGAPYRVAVERAALQVEDFDAGLRRPIRAGLAIESVVLRERAARAGAPPLLALPKLEAKGLAVDLGKRTLDLASLDLQGLQVALQREADGRLDAVRVLVPPAGAAKPSPSASAGPATERPAAPGGGKEAPAPAPAWSGGLGRFALTGGLSFTDRTLAKAVPLIVEGLSIGVDGLDITGAKPAAVRLDASVNRRGRLGVSGTAAWAPLAVDLALDVRELDLVPLQGWAGERLNALITRGNVSVGGRLGLAGGGASPVVARFAGDGRLAGFNVFDRNQGSDILNFKAVELSGLEFVSSPLAVDLKRLLLDEVFARVILGADGKLNLGQLVRPDPAMPAPAAEAVAAEAAPQVTEPPAGRKALPFRIGEIVIRKNRADFSDRFAKPPYHASLTGLDGRIAPLAAGRRGQIELTGAVDRSAPLSISGEVDPFASQIYLNVAARVKGVDMPPLSTYAERWLGYEIEKGKLSLDLRYYIEERKLKAENQLFLDQLTFGRKVESPDAMAVPVTLAVALLKNAQGEIDLDLPIAGSLDDPEFSVARIVFKVLGNLIVKAVTSPFALLGSVFGGGEELSEVGFVAGRATPEADGEKRLQALSRALLDRPGLKLEITGMADAGADRAALGRALLDRRLRARKLEETAGKGAEAGALREVQLSPEERARFLAQLGKEAGIVPPKDAADPLKAIEDGLLAAQVVGEDELRQLAERRGRSVRNWLVERGGVPVERVFVMVPRTDAADGRGGSRAVFSLR